MCLSEVRERAACERQRVNREGQSLRELSPQSQIAEFEQSLRRDVHVGGFDIAVHAPVLVHVLQTGDDLQKGLPVV